MATIDDLKAKLEVVKREHEGANAELRILEANECERPANPLRRSNARRPTVSALTPHIPLIPKVDPISAQATSFNVAPYALPTFLISSIGSDTVATERAARVGSVVRPRGAVNGALPAPALPAPMPFLSRLA